MPRGNDIEGNAVWNEGAYGQYGIFANAEEMINAHRAGVNHAVVKAQLLREDPEATAEARADLDASADKLDLLPGDKLVDCAVRGNALVGVVEDEQGRLRKVVGGWNSDYEAPKLSDAERARADEAKARLAEQTEIARLRASHEKEMAEFRAEAERRLVEALEEVKAAAAAASSNPSQDETVPVSKMTHDQLDAKAEELGLEDWDADMKVAEKRDAMQKALDEIEAEDGTSDGDTSGDD